MLESLRNKRVMVVVAHPDDEVLGLGATFNLLISQYGVTAHVIILGEGITSRSEERDLLRWEAELRKHRENIKSAQSAIGYQTSKAFNFPDNRFDSIDLLDIVKVIEAEKQAFLPDVIFTHHGGDVNIDHQRVFEAVITACRPLKTESVNTIITFETMSGTEWRASSDPRHFIPNFFVSVSGENIKAKISAMESYEFERRLYPHPRSPEALEIVAKRWGVVVGVEYAEAFSIIRVVSK
jgi:LmbE family N-acetylglucosaminyl deacetylase